MNKVSTMKNKLILFVSASIILSSQPIFAAKTPPKYGCPVSRTFKTNGFDNVTHLGGHFYIVVKEDVTDEFNQHWVLHIVNIKARSFEDAEYRAGIALKTLTGWPKPVLENGNYICHYETRQGYKAYAFEPY